MRNLIDLERYPIDRGDADLIAECKRQMDKLGMFNLEGFVRADALPPIVEHVSPILEMDSFKHARMHNIYFKKDLPDVPDDHPVRIEFETSNNTICADQIAGSPLLDLYHWEPFHRFIAAVMDKPMLYPMDDELASLNVMAYGQGQGLNWHFDRSEFTITILLQAPDSGSDFQYRKDLRSDDDPNYDGVARMLAGEDDYVRTAPATAGTLNVFKGKNTAHRVTPAQGPNKRIVSVLTYYERPGVKFTKEEQLGFYGRTTY